MPGPLREIATKAEFDETLSGAGDQLVCVDFTATWCGPCKKIGPKFVEMAGIYEDCQFVKVDVDENEETTTACNVTNMPTFQFYKGGKKVDELCGADAEKLRALVEKHSPAKAHKPSDSLVQDLDF